MGFPTSINRYLFSATADTTGVVVGGSGTTAATMFPRRNIRSAGFKAIQVLVTGDVVTNWEVKNDHASADLYVMFGDVDNTTGELQTDIAVAPSGSGNMSLRMTLKAGESYSTYNRHPRQQIVDGQSTFAQSSFQALVVLSASEAAHPFSGSCEAWTAGTD